MYDELINLAKEGQDVHVAIGGWDLVKIDKRFDDSATMKTFVNNVEEFMRRYHFSGIHFDLTYVSKLGGFRSSRIVELAWVSDDHYHSIF